MARIGSGALFGAGIAVGVGVVLFGPAIWRATRPLAKSALKAGIEGYSVARVAAARAGEEIEDLVAEVAMEMNEAGAAATGEPAAVEPAVDVAEPVR